MVTELKLDDMTPEQKIGHLLVARDFVSEEDRNFTMEMVKKRCVGGIQMGFTPERRKFAKDAKAIADYPLLVCADMESGYPSGIYSHPEALSLINTGDSTIAYLLGRMTAKEAVADGVDVVWGPVLDLALEGAICKNHRCFGDDPETVSRFTEEYIKGFQSEGMTVTAKHFPGGSDVTDDQHMATGICKLTEDELLRKDLIPYFNAMENADLTGIMTGHILCEKIDDKYPASLSKKVIDIIRKRGFDGIIMTDSLAMMAVVQNFSDKEAIGLAVAAGNDMVLPNYRLTYKESFDALMDAYKNGVISEERLNEAVTRVLKAQKRAMNKPKTPDLTEKEIELHKSLTEKCIAVNLRDGVKSALDENTKKLFVLLCENQYCALEYECKEITFETAFCRKKTEELAEKITENFPGSETYIISEFPDPSEIEPLLDKISAADETIFYTYCYAGAYMGSDCLTNRMEYIIDRNQDKISTLIHIGNPYEVKKFKKIKRIIGSLRKNEDIMIKILKGEIEPNGKFPFDL